MKKIVSVMLLFTFIALNTGGAFAQTAGESPKDFSTAKVTIEMKQADIKNALDAFSKQTGLSVVAAKDVEATVTMRLVDVSWDEALDVILRPYGFGYEKRGNIIIVSPVDKLRQMEQAQGLSTKVYTLRYLDALAVQPIIETQLSPRGKIAVLETTLQTGWEFGSDAQNGSSAGSGTAKFGKRQRKNGKQSRSKQFVVTDIPSVLNQISHMLADLDKKPQQIVIEARFMEVNTDRLKDLGLEYGTGSTGTSSATITGTDVASNGAGETVASLGGQFLGSLVEPSSFSPKSTNIDGTSPHNTGLSLRFQRLTGSQFDVLLHALEEDVFTNTLSAPRIMSLNNQEASILVGTQYPILTSNVTGTTSTTTTTSLDYYQDIGIQLNVVPQINEEGNVNMIVHPAVTSFTSTLEARSPEGTVLAEYPIITTREAETNILMKDGETIVIGGLLKDVLSESLLKVPLLGDIPILGLLFQRKTTDVEKIDLLIFITADIVEDGEYNSDTKPEFVTPEKRNKKFSSSDHIKWKEDLETDNIFCNEEAAE